MEVGSSIQRSKWDAHKREFDDHDVSLLRSWKMLIRGIVESGCSDPTIWKYRSVELRHFCSVIVVGPEASGEHRYKIINYEINQFL